MKASRRYAIPYRAALLLAAAAILCLVSSSAQASPRRHGFYYGRFYYGHSYGYGFGHMSWHHPYRSYWYSPHVYFRYPRGYYGYGGYYSSLFMPRYYFWPKYDRANPCYYPGRYYSQTPFARPRTVYRVGGSVTIRVQLVLPRTRPASSSSGGEYRVRVTVETPEG